MYDILYLFIKNLQPIQLFIHKMSSAPITDNSPKSLLKTVDNEHEKSEKKLTVLETHGYALGKTIGSGSYATVKVCSIKKQFIKN